MIITWAAMRGHYVRLFRLSGKSQLAVARRGGVPQNAISRILTGGRPRGASAATFVKAVQGLGMPVSQFFAQLEQAAPRDAAVLPEDGEDELALAIGRAFVEAIRKIAEDNRRRGAH